MSPCHRGHAPRNMGRVRSHMCIRHCYYLCLRAPWLIDVCNMPHCYVTWPILCVCVRSCVYLPPEIWEATHSDFRAPLKAKEPCIVSKRSLNSTQMSPTNSKDNVRWRNCKTLQHTTATYSTHCNKLQNLCNTLQYTAAHCNIPQHTEPRCNTLQHTAAQLQHTATRCNTLQQTATHARRRVPPLSHAQTER